MAKKTKDTILKQLSKKLPDGALFTLDHQKPVEVIPSGISTLDYASGIGGFPRGWMTQIYGKSGAGKSAMCLQTIGNYQKEHPDSLCAIVDLEKSATPEWSAKFGVNVENLIVVRPSNVEEMITMTMQLIESGSLDIIMVDSLGAGLLQSEIENDKTRMGGSAGAITRFCKAANSAFITLERQIKVMEDSGEDTSDITVPSVILINQARAQLNSLVPAVTYSGGYTLTHLLGMNIYLRASGKADDKINGTVDGVKMQVGTRCIADFKKNKLATPNKQAGYNFVWKDCPEATFGIDNVQSIVDLCLTLGIANTAANTILFTNAEGKEDKVVGRKKFVEKVRDDEKLQVFFAEEISKLMAEEAEDEDLEIVNKQNPFN